MNTVSNHDIIVNKGERSSEFILVNFWTRFIGHMIDKFAEIENLIENNMNSKIVKMIEIECETGNKLKRKKDFINQYFEGDYNRFNKAKFKRRSDRQKITIGRSQSIICFNTSKGVFVKVNPVHIFYYKKVLQKKKEAKLLLEFSKN